MKMKLGRRHLVLMALTLTLGLLGTLVFAPIAGMLVGISRLCRRANRGRERLFRETDYRELLAACRELSRRVASGELEVRDHWINLADRHARDLSLPQVILNIEPAILRFDVFAKGAVCIELLPTPDWFGVVAFPEGEEGSGDVKLIDGLWYCDADYRDAYPEHMKWIDARIEEGRRRKENRRSVAPSQPAVEQ